LERPGHQRNGRSAVNAQLVSLTARNKNPRSTFAVLAPEVGARGTIPGASHPVVRRLCLLLVAGITNKKQANEMALAFVHKQVANLVHGVFSIVL
jgi:hypothetical protein